MEHLVQNMVVFCFFRSFQSKETYLKYIEFKDINFLSALGNTIFPGTNTDNEEINVFFDQVVAVYEDFEKGVLSEQEAIKKATRLLDENKLAVPTMPFNESKTRFLSSLSKEEEFNRWIKEEAPSVLKNEFFDFDPSLLMKMH